MQKCQRAIVQVRQCTLIGDRDVLKGDGWR